VQPNGVPVVFTWEASAAKIYSTATAPPTGQTVTTLQAVGVLTVPASTTDGGTLGPTSRKVVSGAALSPDGKKLVVRTLTDAYEWDITGGVVATLKSGAKPRVTPLPNESDGQSITYTTDGAGYVTVSTGKNAKLLSWSPAPLPEPKAATKAGTGPAATAAAPSRSLLSRLTLSQLNGMMLGAAAVGLLMLVGGIVGIVRFRRQLGSEDEPSLQDKLASSRRGTVNGVPQEQWDGDPAAQAGQPTAFAPQVPGGQQQSATTLLAAEQQSGRGGTVYGGNPDSPRRSTVYGAPAEPPPPASPHPSQSGRGGTVYGGGGSSGTTYGTPQPPPAGPPHGGPRGSAPRGSAPRGTTYGSPAPPPGPPQASGLPERPPAGPPRGSGYPAAPPPSPPYGGPGGGYGDPAQQLPQTYRQAPVPPPQPAVYGARPADPDPGQRAQRDWRSRQPPE
jgi:hypothetical protein